MKKYYFNPDLRLLLLALLGFAHIYANAQTPVFEWAKRYGASGYDETLSVTMDENGNVYATGFFSGSVDFNPGTGTAILNATGNDGFILKLRPSGEFAWVRQFGGSGNDYGRSIHIDPLGNAVVAGDFTGSVNINMSSGTVNFATNTTSDILVLKLDSTGNFLWGKQMGGDNENHPFGIATDAAGHIYTTGVFRGTADFSGLGSSSTLTSNSNGEDIFISRLDASGNFVWAKSVGSIYADRALGIAVSPTGNVYATGYFSGDTDFDPGATTWMLTPAGKGSSFTGPPSDIFVLKLDASGSFVWAKSMGGGGADRGQGIAIDTLENVYTTGYFSKNADTADFNPDTTVVNYLISSGGNDVFVSKLDSSGKFVWAKRMGGTEADLGMALSVSQSGKRIFATGYFSNSADIGSFNFTTKGSNDIFVSMLDGESGDVVWAKQFGGIEADQGLAIVTDKPGGIVYSSGYFGNLVDFDPGSSGTTLNSAGGADIFIHKMTQCIPYTLNISDSSCTPYRLNDSVYTQTGVYTQMFVTSGGCDSTIILDLKINEIIHPLISVTGFVLSINTKYASYQWLKDGKIIPGAEDGTYNVTENGDYQVIVSSEEGCTDTSDIYKVNNVGNIKDYGNLTDKPRIYPNPAESFIYISPETGLNADIYNMEGRLIRQFENTSVIDIQDMTKGIYLLMLTDRYGNLLYRGKIVKQ